MKEPQSINQLDNELRELELKRREYKIYYMSLFYDKGTPFYGDVVTLQYHHENIDIKYNELRKDIIDKYGKQH